MLGCVVSAGAAAAAAAAAGALIIYEGGGRWERTLVWPHTHIDSYDASTMGTKTNKALGKGFFPVLQYR